MGKKKLKNWGFPQKKKVDPGLLAAVEMASYQLQKQKEARKVLAVDKEVAIVTEAHEAEVENWMWACFALALHRVYGFGGIRIAKAFYAAQDIHNDCVDQGMSEKDIQEMVADECGLGLQNETAEELYKQVEKILSDDHKRRSR